MNAVIAKLNPIHEIIRNGTKFLETAPQIARNGNNSQQEDGPSAQRQRKKHMLLSMFQNFKFWLES